MQHWDFTKAALSKASELSTQQTTTQSPREKKNKKNIAICPWALDSIRNYSETLHVKAKNSIANNWQVKACELWAFVARVLLGCSIHIYPRATPLSHESLLHTQHKKFKRCLGFVVWSKSLLWYYSHGRSSCILVLAPGVGWLQLHPHYSGDINTTVVWVQSTAQRSVVCTISVKIYQDQRVCRAVWRRLSLSDTDGCRRGEGVYADRFLLFLASVITNTTPTVIWHSLSKALWKVYTWRLLSNRC